MTKIELTSTKDITLKTAGKYCEEDIQINQNLERRAFTPSGEQAILYPSDGHNGISEIVVYKNPTEKVIVQSSDTIQTFTPTEGKFYDEVEVQPIPEGYIIPSGNIDINSNQVVDVTQYSQATISVPTGGGGEDLIGSMMTGIPVDYVDTQRSITFVSKLAMAGINRYLNSIELPVCSVIGEKAFIQTSYKYEESSQYEGGITKLSIPQCLHIGSTAFMSCFHLSQIYAPVLESIDGLCFKNCTNLSQLDLPQVTYVGSQAFMSCGLTSINLPNLQIASSTAFFRCYSVVEFSFPKLVEIGNGAFSNNSMTYFYAPNLSTLTGSAFAYCGKLSSFVVDYTNLETIPSSCFTACYLLSNFDAPNCLSIQVGAFEQCSGLISVNFPNAIRIDGAFKKCTALSDVNLPMCSIIGVSAFIGCTSLSKISLPLAGTLSSYAFSGCTNLSMFILPSTSVVKLATSSVFNNTPIKSSGYLGYFGSIYVPSDLVDSYKASTNWTYYSDRITSIENLPTT